MNLKTFWKREKLPEQHLQQQPDSSNQKPSFRNRKHQHLVWRESKLCVTIPQKAVETFHISTKRFFAWQAGKKELVGTLVMSETTITTRVELLSHKEQYLAMIPPLYNQYYEVKFTKNERITAICEWDDIGLQIRIPLKKPLKAKKKKK